MGRQRQQARVTRAGWGAEGREGRGWRTFETVTGLSREACNTTAQVCGSRGALAIVAFGGKQ